MRVSTYLATVSVLLFAGSGALAYHQYRELVALRARVGSAEDRARLEARLAGLQRRNAELEARLAASDHRAAAGSEAGADARDGGAGATLVADAGAKSAEGGHNRKQEELDLLATLADMPEFQKLLALQQHGAIATKYAALFRRLHLSPEQQQQFEQLLADKQSAFADALLAAHDQGLTGSEARKMAMTVARATQKDIDASMKSLLGDQAYQQYRNYERTLPQRDVVNQLAQRLSYTSAPLTPHQQDQLVQTLASSARRGANGTPAMPGQTPSHPPKNVPALPGAINALGIGSRDAAPITTSGVAQAQTFLSPQQLSALQQMQQEQQAQQTLGKLLRRGPGANPAPKAPKPGKG